MLFVRSSLNERLIQLELTCATKWFSLWGFLLINRGLGEEFQPHERHTLKNHSTYQPLQCVSIAHINTIMLTKPQRCAENTAQFGRPKNTVCVSTRLCAHLPSLYIFCLWKCAMRVCNQKLAARPHSCFSRARQFAGEKKKTETQKKNLVYDAFAHVETQTQADVRRRRNFRDGRMDAHVFLPYEHACVHTFSVTPLRSDSA